MNDKVKAIRCKIENLRNHMILTFMQEGSDLNHPNVLRLSQLLDEQLNNYEECLRQLKVSSKTLFAPIRRQCEFRKSCNRPVS